MDDTPLASPTTTADAEIPERRSCTRCDGSQHLVAAHQGMGKYRCDTCQLVVGFDLAVVPVEFLIDRGLPGHYTRDVFGGQLLGSEQRLVPANDPVA